MATFEIKTKLAVNVKGEYVDKGLSVQITTMYANPFEEKDKIHNAFLRVHGLDFKTEGYLSIGYFTYPKM